MSLSLSLSVSTFVFRTLVYLRRTNKKAFFGPYEKRRESIFCQSPPFFAAVRFEQPPPTLVAGICGGQARGPLHPHKSFFFSVQAKVASLAAWWLAKIPAQQHKPLFFWLSFNPQIMTSIFSAPSRGPSTQDSSIPSLSLQSSMPGPRGVVLTWKFSLLPSQERRYILGFGCTRWAKNAASY